MSDQKSRALIDFAVRFGIAFGLLLGALGADVAGVGIVALVATAVLFGSAVRYVLVTLKPRPAGRRPLPALWTLGPRDPADEDRRESAE